MNGIQLNKFREKCNRRGLCSKHELSAFFRHPSHRQYRECKDQVFRKFLQGMQQKYRSNIY
ncbi:MAG: DUF1456 family protein [Deltaproteobacteria bacterium]|nr:DUF1456 family protein [Deltaproteobacteria bacterium]